MEPDQVTGDSADIVGARARSQVMPPGKTSAPFLDTDSAHSG